MVSSTQPPPRRPPEPAASDTNKCTGESKSKRVGKSDTRSKSTGKSKVIAWIRELFEHVLGWQHGVQFVCLAYDLYR